MLQPILKDLNNLKIVLASTSPRREMLLENIGLKFSIVPSNFEENLKKDNFATPLEYVNETAKQKTLDVVNRLYSNKGVLKAVARVNGLNSKLWLLSGIALLKQFKQETSPDLIIGADTIVTMDNKIFEKPSSRENAIQILMGFSGRSHTVYTSVVLVTPNKADTGDPYSLIQFYEATKVNMGDLTRQIVEAYVDTGEPMDKAGGYGIQALGSTLIKGVSGDYFNVIGFPLHPFAKHILELFPPS